MRQGITRRRALTMGGALCLTAASTPRVWAGPPDPVGAERIAGIEQGLGGRIGVAVLDSAAGLRLAYRANEMFPLCSTFKVIAAAAILARVDAGTEHLERTMRYESGDLDAYAPVTKAALDSAGGQSAEMSLEALCAAAMVWSDNTAANLMLRALGGPEAVTACFRSLGDGASRLDRTEPMLNTAIPGDARDTTNPAAMAGDLKALLLGDGLKSQSRARLEGWMVAAKTGARRLRAGLPPDWIVGDKTGSGDHATTNVVAILRPPERAPIFAAIYMTGSPQGPATRDAAHAEIGRIITQLA